MKRFVAAVLLITAAFIGGAAPAQERDAVWMSQNTLLVTPGTKFTMLVHAADWHKPLRFRVYRIGIDDAVELVRGRGTDLRPAGVPVWQGTRVPHVGTYWWMRQVAIGPFPTGLYAIEVSSGDATMRVLGDVSTLGTLGAFNAGSSGVWAIDLRSFQRHMGPTTVTFFSENSRKQYACDPAGLAQFGGMPPASSVLVARTADGSVDVEPAYAPGDEQTHGVQYVQTDRPVYRPGQDVYYRAILREGFEGAYRIPDGTHRITVVAPDQSTIYERRLTLSRFGTLNGRVTLPQGAQLGNYTLEIDGKYGWNFTVAAYKKPEYLLDAQGPAAAVIGGSDALVRVKASYFFGRPAAGMHVHYSAYGVPQPAAYTPYAFYGRLHQRGTSLPEISGDAVTGGDGTAQLHVGTRHTDFAYYLPVRIEARDASGRTVETSATVYVDPAAVVLSLAPRRWFAKPGETVFFDLSSTDVAQKHVPGARVHVIVTRNAWNAKSQRFDETQAFVTDVTTGAGGKGVFAWLPREPGAYRILATTHDAAGNASSAYSSMWIVGGDESWMPPDDQPVAIAEHETLKPGERPRVLVRLPGPGRDVLLAVIADRVTSLRVLHVTGYAASIALDAPAQASHFTVNVSLPMEYGIAQAQATFTRDPQPQALHLTIVPDRAKYAPGDAAAFAIRATDAAGKPAVHTEVSVAVVDDAIYAVQSSNAADPLQTFFGNTSWQQMQWSWNRPNYVPPAAASEEGVPQGAAMKTIAKVASRAAGALVRPGIAADVYSVGGGPAIALRTRFSDTAYWTPSVTTDRDGRAVVHFIWPDNLTTWRTSGLGVTADTRLGTGSAESLVTKDFLVRLEVPRFLRKGDSTTIVAIAHGQRDAGNVRLRFTPQVDDPLEAALRLDANETASTQWSYDAGSVLGMRTLTLTGSDGIRTDGVQLPLPVEAAGAAEHVRDAGDVRSRSSVAVALPAGYDAGDLTATLTPSLTAQLVQNLRLLDVYPYYCTEQTMSAALPAIFIERVVKRLGYELPGDIKPAQVVAHAIARLRDLQHPDGSWGWWENDPAHPFMTAYALYGLSQFRAAGYTVPAAMYDRGVENLVTQLGSQYTDTLRLWGGAQTGSEWNTRAFMLFSLASAAPERVDRDLLDETARHAPSLNSYALAVLGLAYHALGGDSQAREILTRLNARAVTNGAYTYWSGETWHYAWQDDPIETTAYALRLNAALQPDAPIVGRVTAFLRSERRGDWWFTTKDTAAAIYAIAEADRDPAGEFAPDETARVFVDGKLAGQVRIKKPLLDAAQAEIRIPASAVHDGSVVSFERVGRGALYWSTDFVRYAPPGAHTAADPNRSLLARLFPKQPPLRIERRYTLSHGGAWRVGDEVRVDVTVTAKDDLQYVAIEDPFPAGAEYAPPQGDGGAAAWSGLQLFDDRAVFFATMLNARWPLHLQYSLRVTTPGTYTAAAPTAYAMYGPPIYAVGDRTRVSVAP